MRILLLVTLMLPFLTHASGWKDYMALKKKQVSHERHLPYRLYHGHKTAKSVLLVHGIYSSPLYFKGMARAYFEAGFNVVTILLPGHWDKDFYSIDKLTFNDWIKEVDTGYELAKELGDQVILSGHSLGALLSVEQSLKRPRSEVHSLVLISPSLKVWSAIMASCRAGLAFNLNGNNFTFKKPDGFHIPYLAPKAGPMIQGLADQVLTRPIKVPFFLAFTWNDNVVDVNFVKKYYDSVTAPKELITFGLFSGISHGDISQAPSDLPTYMNKTNHEFDFMMNSALRFVQLH